MNTRILSTTAVLLGLQACCNGYEFREGGCASGGPAAATGCELADGSRSSPENQQLCCTDQPFRPEDLEAFLARNTINTCCNGTSVRLPTADDPCSAFRDMGTGLYNPAQAAGVCAANFAALAPDAQIDNLCCNAGALRAEAGSTAACISRFPSPQPSPSPTILNTGAATQFCSSYESTFNAQNHNASGCQSCSQAKIDPVTGQPPSGCPRSPSENSIDQLGGAARSIQVAIRELGNAETLLGGNTLSKGRATANAATAAPGTSTVSKFNPTLPLSKPPARSAGNSAPSGGGSGGGFLGGPSLGTGELKSQEAQAVSLDSAGALAAGGGGGEFRGRAAVDSTGDSDGISDGSDVEGKLDGLLFKGGNRQVASNVETPEDYWNRISKALSLFEVVTRGYRRESGRWALATVRAIQSPQKRVLNSAPKSGTKRR